MQAILDYFQTIPSFDRTLFLVGGISFFWGIENLFPLHFFSYKKWTHAKINLFFTLTTIVVNFLLAFLLIQTSAWANTKEIGLWFLWEDLNIGVKVLLGLLVMDFIGAYFVHWLEHKIKWMWKFHLIHHSDNQVDTTTANRHHPGESIFRFIFTILAVLVVGAPMGLVMLYQTLSALLSQFNHANIVLPQKIDTFLSFVLVTPNMHHVHHHFVQPQTDSNYGNIFSIWDRFFGTFLVMENQKINYGVDILPHPKEQNDIKLLLKIPFLRQNSK